MVLKYMDGKSIQETSTAKEISKELKTPFDTTAKMMQILKKAQVLSSTQGVQGGYTLIRPLDQISYYEFSQFVGEKSMALDCINGCCEQESSCNISNPMKKLNASLVDYFSQLTIKELLA